MGLGAATVIAGGLARCLPDWSRSHWVHETYAKIYVVADGAGTYENECSRVALEPGWVYFFPPHQASRHTCPERMDVYWTHISIEAPLLDLRLRAVRSIRRWPESAWRRWREVWRALPRMMPTPTLAQELRLQGLLMDTFAQVLEGERDVVEDAALIALQTRFEPTLRFIDAHFRRNPSLAELARSRGMSAPHFHREFLRAFRVTPHRYLLRRRMDVAQQLLVGSALPVAEVARQSGYEDAGYFSRTFKRFFLLCPEEFRSRRRGGA
jgi:AraC-like DNA-binding protein